MCLPVKKKKKRRRKAVNDKSCGLYYSTLHLLAIHLPLPGSQGLPNIQHRRPALEKEVGTIVPAGPYLGSRDATRGLIDKLSLSGRMREWGLQ